MVPFVWLIAAGVLCAGPTVWGRVLYVDDDAAAPGDGASWATAYRYLQDALTAAATVDEPVEIRVAQGTYKPDRNSMHPEGTGDTTAVFLLADGMSLLGGYAGIAGADPNQKDLELHETVLSGDLRGDDAEVSDPTLLRNDQTRVENSWQVVYSHNGHVRLEGFTITGGTAGGVFLDQWPRDKANDVTVSDCRFSGNRGSQDDTPTAGALTTWMFVIEPKVAVRRCAFIGNAGEMGAISLQSAVLDQCHFERNHSWGEWGGAGVVTGNSNVTDCVFMGNSARHAAGALYVYSPLSEESDVLRCTFHGNSATESGGGLVCDGNINVRECVFTGNRAGVCGGAGCDIGSDTVHIGDSILAGNRAGECGGAWGSYALSSLEVLGCTIAYNRAVHGQSLVVDYSDTNPSCVAIRNCALSGGADQVWSDASAVEIAYTCFAGGGRISADPGDWLTLGKGNIEADPLFVDPGYWDANGTPDDPNDDFFVAGDYHLKSQAGRWDPAGRSWVQDDVTSPCIDAGDPNDPIGDEPFPNGGIINMGAYGGTAEASKSYFGQPLCQTVIAGDLNGDCIVDWTDLAILVRHWLETGTLESE